MHNLYKQQSPGKQAPSNAFTATSKPRGAYLGFNGGADGGMQLMQAGLQVAPVPLAVALHEEAGGPEPGLLPAPRCRLPAGLQGCCHLLKQLLLQPLHALLHLHTSKAQVNMSVHVSKGLLRKREEAFEQGLYCSRFALLTAPDCHSVDELLCAWPGADY